MKVARLSAKNAVILVAADAGGYKFSWPSICDLVVLANEPLLPKVPATCQKDYLLAIKIVISRSAFCWYRTPKMTSRLDETSPTRLTRCHKEKTMKTKFITLTLIAALSTAVATSAFAQDYSRSQPTANQLAPYGYTSSANAARVINIDSSTPHLNVTRLETVKINVGGKTVTWTFDTLGTAAFPLARIIPGAEGVTVYVAENPAYQGS